ncbi:hypothetical protein LCGC14_2782690 [marine sediment metagenome]|uniref:Uncharacterized protein n=1 Tax=marine sediment metagenome TaxID=412755 RepID=A0A0F8YSU9_9ZZZZ
MRKFTIIGEGDGVDRFCLYGKCLCWLNPDVFKWPTLMLDEVIQVMELPLQKAGILRSDTDGVPWYWIKVGDDLSGHCGRDFERFTHKRYHLDPGGSMPVSTIKLLLNPR